jgi:hypothetical protein
LIVFTIAGKPLIKVGVDGPLEVPDPGVAQMLKVLLGYVAQDLRGLIDWAGIQNIFLQLPR